MILLTLLFAGLPLAAKAAPLLATLLRVVDTPGVGSYTAMAMDASGKPVISYYDAVNGDLKLAYCDDPNCNSANIKVLDGTDDVGGYTSIALDSLGRPVVSYYNWTADNLSLKLARCNDPACNTVTVNTVDHDGPAPGNVGQHTSIALDSADRPVIAYQDQANGNLKLVHCADPTCTAPHSSMNIVDSGGTNVGPGASLVLDALGIPVISYRANNDALRLAYCNALDCTAPTIRTLDGPPASAIAVMPSSTTLVLKAGNPLISYHGNGELRLARCNNPTCNLFDPVAHVTIVDAVSAQYHEMALDSIGNPVIAYFDSGPFSVKLVHCIDPDCASVSPLPVDSGGGTFISMALGCDDNAVMAYQHLGGLKVASDDACSLPPSSPTGSSGPSASKPIAPTGTTSLGLSRRIIVYVPAEAIPAGQTNCSITIREDGESGRFGIALDDTVWDVKITCDSGELKIFMAPLTTCILPLDNTLSDKNVYHRHGDGGFQAISGGSGLPGWVCGQTRVLSLFTLGQLALPATGFAPGVVARLSAQPAELAYVASDLVLNIPRLGVQVDVLGVPKGPNGWDVTWLSPSQAGYLYGTAFPTWRGNSVLTAHVWNADNTPGPFHALKNLQHGDRFTISAYGYTYTYEVRSNQLVSPSSLRVMETSEYNLITLITCESYSESAGGYLYRRAVQAVLVSVGN